MEYLGTIVQGDVIEWTETVWSMGWARGRVSGTALGERITTGEIIRESYGSTGQHTFSIRVIKSNGHDPHPKSKEIRRKGRTIYREFRHISRPDNLAEVAEEKHRRGDDARARREARRNEW